MTRLTEFERLSIPEILIILFSFSIPFSKTVSSFFALGLLIYYVSTGEWQKKWSFLKSSTISCACIGLFIWTMAAGLYSEAPIEFIKQDLYKYKKLLVVVPLLYYMKQSLKPIMLAAYVAGVFMLIALAIAKGGHGFIHLIQTGNFAYTDSFRIYISEGMHFAFVFFILSVAFIKFIQYRVYIGILLSILITHVLFMNGRMGLISMLASFLCTVYWLLPSIKARITVVAFLILVGYGIFASSPLVQSRVTRTIEEASQVFSPGEPTSIRFQYFQVSWQLFQHHPLVGAGPGSFHAATTASGRGGIFEQYTHTHNEFLTLLSQYGIVGLGIFGMVLIAIRRQLIEINNLDERHIGTVALLIFLLNAMTDSMLYMEGYLFVLIVALCYARIKSQ